MTGAGMTSVLGKALIGGLMATTRIVRIDEEHLIGLREVGRNVIFVFWHGQLFPLLYAHRHEGIVVLVSEHGDGERIAQIIERYGFGTARGSSTRGGTRGLRDLIRQARNGRDLGLTPDGPRGPARVVKPGALLAAQATGAPLVPIAAAAAAGWRLGSWDRFLVPRPFTRVTVGYGEPIWIDRNTDPKERARLATQIGEQLNALTERVARVSGTPEHLR